MTERFFIIIKGELSRLRAAWFSGITVTPVEPGFTLLSGEFRDQAALHGVLTRIRDLGLPIVALTTHTSRGPVPAEPQA